MAILYPLLPVLLALLGCQCQAFSPSSTLPTQQNKMNNKLQQSILQKISNPKHNRQIQHSSPTTLYNGVIIDVDDNFFTTVFFSIGLFYSLGKAYNRFLLEELAFEQRKLEARERRLEQDPTLNELDLRREESAAWPSVYARTLWGEGETFEDEGEGGQRRRSRVSVLDREEGDVDDEEYGMSDEEIGDFESSSGVEYDPYYDEPYEESELPVGKYKEDKSYGDRRYVNGEVFYKDENTGMFFRQGSRPRQKKFWDLNSSP
mmetsp:Transcript_27835/g.50333  ORF Transcript_27835/g.50333 Transcript_27835/m.50333 type:complete len:261 (-) Transcript_27835:244-1026(-)|eukprot:CAMPEP_0201940254 /NCGR_PEP_ID=MMETSP0903-20130614/44857_1 /ASSEMBLY_ACC=CAM_ASM_000552 /TAXON_ID=420261 /ORGANISM="Thalassiosira antarctica, Strain CCMP982" /LENGTH=260 /DNA_ID=CAMNT_0048482009 /DNA_START=146 /DNA_END=928 /DNA_ORIENTATION=-